MNDIARLGLQIDTRPITDATKALRQFESAAAPAERAVDRLEKGTQRAGTASKQLTQQTGLARHEMINLSRQVQDIGVSLASGQSPFTVLVQQGTQVADIFGNTRGTFRGFAGQIASVLTPMRLLAGGLVAIGAGTVAALSYWKNFALTLEDASRAAEVSYETFAKLQTVAAFKGIDAQSFQTGMKGLAEELYRAKNNAGELREVFRVNGVEVKGTADALVKVADLIKNSTSYQQKLSILQKAGLPTTAEWVRFMEQGGEAVKRATEGVAEFGGEADKNLRDKAREFDEAWNKAWANFGLYSRSYISQAASGIMGLINQASDFGTKLLSRLASGGLSEIGANLLKTGRGTALSQNVDDLYGGLLPGGKGKPTVDPNAIRDYERLRDAIKNKVDQQRIELNVQGMSEGAAARYRAVQEALLQAKQQHIQLSPEQIASLEREAGALEGLTNSTKSAAASISLMREVEFERMQLTRSNTEAAIASRLRSEYGDQNYMAHLNDAVAGQMRLNATLKETKDLAEDALGSFLTDLAQGKSATESLQSVLRNLEAQLIKMATNRLISELFGAVLGGSTGGVDVGLLSKLFHTGYGPGDPITMARFVPSSAFNGAPRYHSGIGPGEQAAVIRRDESVLTPGQMKALGTRIGGGGNGITIAPSVNVTMPAGGKPEDGQRFGSEISRAIVVAVQAEMIKQSRFGGLLRSA